jgi:enoyl-CoA hydratase/carnithine racemase
MSTGWGGGARLVKLLGRQRALRLLCGSEKMTAKYALEHGFADAVALDTCIEAVSFDFIRAFDSKEPGMHTNA